MVRHVLAVVRAAGMREMILMGGVRADNLRAEHFYRKHGFREVGQFEMSNVNNYDMICPLARIFHASERKFYRKMAEPSGI
jgi:ribosomal protein S18 acetylase RimI-like enzyme